jgi:hypothetical protein
MISIETAGLLELRAAVAAFRRFAPLLSIGLAAPALADTLHVPADFPTIGSALAAAGPGDEIQVSAGTYSPGTGESFPLVVSTDGIRLLGAGMGLSILDAAGSAGVIRHEASGGGRIAGFTIGGGIATSGGGIHVTSGDVEIDHNLVTDNRAAIRGAGIFVDRASAPPIAPWIHHNVVWANFDSNPADSTDPHGILYSGQAHGVLEHNVIGRSDGNGALTTMGATPSIRHNIFFDNGVPGPPPRGRGICILAGTPPVVFHNLFFMNEIAAILWPAGGGNMSGGFANGVSPTDQIYGNLDGNPLFVDADGGDLHLQSQSPAIDAGDPTLPFDPDGTIADLGPFYFDQGGGTDAPRAAGARVAISATPNPFRTETVISCAAPRTGRARVVIVDVRGRIVRRLADEVRGAGLQHWVWDGLEESGAHAAAGVYLARVEIEGRAQTLPIVRLH